MIEIKNFYRYCVLINEIGRPYVNEEEIPMEITRNQSLMRQNNQIEILGYAEAHSDYGFVPHYENMGKIFENYLWLEESNIEKARDIFVADTRSKIQSYFQQIDIMKEKIATQGNYLKALEDITYQVKNQNVVPKTLYHYDEEERDEV